MGVDFEQQSWFWVVVLSVHEQEDKSVEKTHLVPHIGPVTRDV